VFDVLSRAAPAGAAAGRLRDGRRLPARPAGEVLARIGDLVAAHGTELWEADEVTV
jgi:threonyl-tRNA synthetase